MSRDDIYKRAHDNTLACTRIGMTYRQIAEEANTNVSNVARCFNYDTWAQHASLAKFRSSAPAIERIASLNLSEMEKKYADRDHDR